MTYHMDKEEYCCKETSFADSCKSGNCSNSYCTDSCCSERDNCY